MIKWRRYMIVSFAYALLLVLGTGCADNNSNAHETQEISTEISKSDKYVEKIDSSISKNYNVGFEKELLSSYRFSEKSKMSSVSGVKQGYLYGRYMIYIDGLIEEDDVKTVEYSLSNCVGSFMDEFCVKDTGPDTIREAILNVKNKPFCMDKDSQDGIFFTAYYYCDYIDNSAKKTQQIQSCVKELRITAAITYEDGSQEVRNYGVEFVSDTSTLITTMRVVLLK